MKIHELSQLMQFATLLNRVIPLLGRLLEEELPRIGAQECHNDLHRQLALPLADLDEASGRFGPEPRHEPGGHS